jgi:hypothetical protein
MVAFTALLAEFLIVALSGLPLRPSAQPADEFFLCGVSALVILAIMVLIVLAVNLWRRALPHLPRKPDSTAAVMTYLAGSGMVRDFEGVERMKEKERNRWIEMQGRRYEYTLRRRRDDGRLKWTVDHSSKGGESEWDEMSHHSLPTDGPRFRGQHGHGHQRSLSRFD